MKWLRILSMSLIMGLGSSLLHAQQRTDIQECRQDIQDCLSEIRTILTLAQNIADVVDTLNDEYIQLKLRMRAVRTEISPPREVDRYHATLKDIYQNCQRILLTAQSYAARSVVDGKIYRLPKKFIDAGFGFEDLNVYEPVMGEDPTADDFVTADGSIQMAPSDVRKLKAHQIMVLPTMWDRFAPGQHRNPEFEQTYLAPTEGAYRDIYFRDGKYVVEFMNGAKRLYEIQGKRLIETRQSPNGSIVSRAIDYVSPEDRIQRAISKVGQTSTTYSYDPKTQIITKQSNGLTSSEQLKLPADLTLEIRDGRYVILKDTVRGITYGEGGGLDGGSGGTVALASDTSVTYGHTLTESNYHIQDMIQNHVESLNSRAFRQTVLLPINILGKQISRVHGPNRYGYYQLHEEGNQTTLLVNPYDQAIEFQRGWQPTARVIAGSEQHGAIEVETTSPDKKVKHYQIIFSSTDQGNYTVQETK